MYSITIFDNLTSENQKTIIFDTKRKANKFLKDNTEKRGYDFFSKDNRSVEYRKNY
jgi:hypothetical protein